MTALLSLIFGAMLILTTLMFNRLGRRDVLPWITLAWAAAWGVSAMVEPTLWPIVALGFVQNVAFTFVSRGRNSGSLGYHFLASIFSNGIYAALLFFTIDMISQAKSMPVPFLAVYTLSTMSGSIFAHWLAMRTEKGKARNVQQTETDRLCREFTTLKSEVFELSRTRSVRETLQEVKYLDRRMRLRVWYPESVSIPCEDELIEIAKKACKDTETNSGLDLPSIAEHVCLRLGANAVQVSTDGIGAVFYHEWP